jgi:hypothetical protein
VKLVLAAEFPGLRAALHYILTDGADILGINNLNRSAGCELFWGGSQNWGIHDILHRRRIDVLIKNRAEKTINQTVLVGRIVKFYDWGHTI